MTTLIEMVRKAIRAERHWAAEYVRAHGCADVADAIESGAHLKPIEPVSGPDMRD